MKISKIFLKLKILIRKSDQADSLSQNDSPLNKGGIYVFSEVKNLQEGKKKTGSRKKTAAGKPGKYAGYIRITVLAVIIASGIFAVDSMVRSSRPEGSGDLKVSVDTAFQDELPEEADEPAVTSPSLEKVPYEKKEINEKDFRPIVKTRADLSVGELVMVNRKNLYNFPNMSAQMVNMASEMNNQTFKISYNTLTLQKSAMDALNKMMADFYEVFATGDVTVVSSAVTYQEQNRQYNPPAPKTAVLENETQISPGYSEHHTGYAFDLKLVNSAGKISAYDGTGNYRWLNDNCYKYGFLVRYPNMKEEITGMAANPAHFRYVGVPHSYIMRENDFTLEEYMNWLKKYIHGYEHMYYSVYGYDYEIYFVPADAEAETIVPVPKNEDYSVSGNNCDGFIVTIIRKSDELKQQEAAEAAAAAAAAMAGPAVSQQAGAEVTQDAATSEAAVSEAAAVSVQNGAVQITEPASEGLTE